LFKVVALLYFHFQLDIIWRDIGVSIPLPQQ